MKKTIFIFLLAAISILDSCNKEESTFLLGIDVQGFFNQDNVQVFIDGEELLNERLQTDPVIACTNGIIRIAKNEGIHKIKITVNDTVIKTETFQMHNDLYIGVCYNREEVIWFVYSDKPFIYR